MSEAEKYAAVWENPAYRRFSPGEDTVQMFLDIVDPKHGATLRDLGCGTGRAGVRLRDAGLDVTQYDFAANCRDAGIDLPFVLHDLMEPIDGIADYAYCCDVLEHIDEASVARVLRNVVAAGRRVFVQICCQSDDFGALIGEPLHLTVQPAQWWREQLEALDCKILWDKDWGSWCAFYVTAYADGDDFAAKMTVNVSHDEITANVRANLECGYAEVSPCVTTETPLMILAGGPSLNEFADEIVERRKAGEFIVTMNGTHNWCREHGITSSIHIQCDAREFNKRFVAEPFERCRYLIASQCHPAVAASLPKEQVLLWHSGAHMAETLAAFDRERNQSREWFPVGGGGTVLLRGLPLLMMLGFRRFELFGADSSVRDGAHHAYAQPENDRNQDTGVRIGGREFRCHPWMIAQAAEFIRLQKYIAAHIELCVRGDGLLAHIIATAAED